MQQLSVFFCKCNTNMNLKPPYSKSPTVKYIKYQSFIVHVSDIRYQINAANVGKNLFIQQIRKQNSWMLMDVSSFFTESHQIISSPPVRTDSINWWCVSFCLHRICELQQTVKLLQLSFPLQSESKAQLVQQTEELLHKLSLEELSWKWLRVQKD